MDNLTAPTAPNTNFFHRPFERPATKVKNPQETSASYAGKLWKKYVVESYEKHPVATVAVGCIATAAAALAVYYSYQYFIGDGEDITPTIPSVPNNSGDVPTGDLLQDKSSVLAISSEVIQTDPEPDINSTMNETLNITTDVILINNGSNLTPDVIPLNNESSSTHEFTTPPTNPSEGNSDVKIETSPKDSGSIFNNITYIALACFGSLALLYGCRVPTQTATTSSTAAPSKPATKKTSNPITPPPSSKKGQKPLETDGDDKDETNLGDDREFAAALSATRGLRSSSKTLKSPLPSASAASKSKPQPTQTPSTPVQVSRQQQETSQKENQQHFKTDKVFAATSSLRRSLRSASKPPLSSLPPVSAANRSKPPLTPSTPIVPVSRQQPQTPLPLTTTAPSQSAKKANGPQKTKPLRDEAIETASAAIISEIGNGLILAEQLLSQYARASQNSKESSRCQSALEQLQRRYTLCKEENAQNTITSNTQTLFFNRTVLLFDLYRFLSADLKLLQQSTETKKKSVAVERFDLPQSKTKFKESVQTWLSQVSRDKTKFEWMFHDLNSMVNFSFDHCCNLEAKVDVSLTKETFNSYETIFNLLKETYTTWKAFADEEGINDNFSQSLRPNMATVLQMPQTLLSDTIALGQKKVVRTQSTPSRSGYTTPKKSSINSNEDTSSFCSPIVRSAPTLVATSAVKSAKKISQDLKSTLKEKLLKGEELKNDIVGSVHRQQDQGMSLYIIYVNFLTFINLINDLNRMLSEGNETLTTQTFDDINRNLADFSRDRVLFEENIRTLIERPAFFENETAEMLGRLLSKKDDNTSASSSPISTSKPANPLLTAQ